MKYRLTEVLAETYSNYMAMKNVFNLYKTQFLKLLSENIIIKYIWFFVKGPVEIIQKI
jgi:hypothetical protein